MKAAWTGLAVLLCGSLLGSGCASVKRVGILEARVDELEKQILSAEDETKRSRSDLEARMATVETDFESKLPEVNSRLDTMQGDLKTLKQDVQIVIDEVDKAREDLVGHWQRLIEHLEAHNAILQTQWGKIRELITKMKEDLPPEEESSETP